MSGKSIDITAEQRHALRELWFVYGNNGKKHNDGDHKFIQRILADEINTGDYYRPTDECVAAVKSVLDGDLDAASTV